MDNTNEVVLSGHVKNNTILLDDNIQLPEGIKVTIIVPSQTPQPSSGLCGIWQDERPVEEIVQEVIGSRSLGRNTADL